MRGRKFYLTLQNKRFGNLVSSDVEGTINGTPAVLCHCDCGASKLVRNKSLTRKLHRQESCGNCGLKEARIQATKKARSPDHQAATELGITDAKLIKRAIHLKNFGLRHVKGCSLTSKEILPLILSPCSYCGKEGGAKMGIDRVDSSLGYHLGNVVSCCWDCNCAKGAKSVVEYKEWLKRAFKFNFPKGD